METEVILINVNKVDLRSIIPFGIIVNLFTVIFLVVSNQTYAGPSLYNMDRLLAEQYPLGTGTLAAVETVMPKKKVLPEDASLDDEYNFANPNKSLVSEIYDPFESLNRLTFTFNETVREYFLSPIVKWYNANLPDVARDSIENFLNNISSPAVLANDILQAEGRRGLKTATRILINTTVGLGGIIDVAERLGFSEHREDFGQTLAVWGVEDGFYLVLPLLGPSNPRDASGLIFIDSYFDPFGYYLDKKDLSSVKYGLTGLQGITTYASVVNDLESIKETSLDFYGTVRSLHHQRRGAAILNKESSD